MAEEFVSSDDRAPEVQSSRERIKHLLVGSPRAVKRTIQILHIQGYAEVSFWSKPVAAQDLGEPGEVVSVLLRYGAIE
ncbi:MAG: hypothetical protein KME15_09445 [Drouetiella hepatica Uher 2000/2452]|jgi:hypothetical protein|uniref:Uncharacterized protein n=1 Tax=Drouetiella hepatica Uher 2000/2452 TaxID=904376 RepID=A0A951Q9V5_9CYAN|nr:hypothetical protein [Drouetiella hepatica Uher 2000/2452]